MCARSSAKPGLKSRANAFGPRPRNASELPEALQITSYSLCTSIPAAAPSSRASDAAAALQNASMLLHSFATDPMPTAPTWITSREKDFSSGRFASNSAASPPTMMTMVPSVARGTPPETGASSIFTPLAASPASTRRAVAGELVDRSITTVPGLACAAMPAAPSVTSSTCFGIGREVNTTSDAAATAAVEAPAAPPIAVQAATASGLRSNTVTA